MDMAWQLDDEVWTWDNDAGKRPGTNNASLSISNPVKLFTHRRAGIKAH